MYMMKGGGSYDAIIPARADTLISPIPFYWFSQVRKKKKFAHKNSIFLPLHRTGICLLNGLCVPCEHAFERFDRRLPVLLSFLDLLCINLQINFFQKEVNINLIAILHECDWTTNRSFRSHMPDAGAAGSAREPAVSNKDDFFVAKPHEG